MSRYVGLTIGPIIKTLNAARKTGELWASSYIFSYIMKRLIWELKNEKDKNENKKYEFVIPYTDDNTYFTDPIEVGIFHDRFMFEINENENFETIRESLDKKIELILNDISSHVIGGLKTNGGSKNYDEKKVRKYIKDYFKLYYAAIEIEENSYENPILKMMSCLDALELKEKFVNEIEEDYLEKYLTNKNIKMSFLADDAFKKKMRILPSIQHIAMAEHVGRLKEAEQQSLQAGVLELDDDKQQEQSFVKLKEILKKEDKFRKTYNYAALVQADADNMGNMIKELWGDGRFKEFSKTMMEFGLKANEIIKEFNGFTLYAGGDDLLFFSPVINKKQTVFNLVEKLNEEFSDMFKEFNNGVDKPFTYSFGVFIFYYKYPLYEALGQVRELLFNKAKEYKNEVLNKEKNSIAFGFLKHSGQMTSAVVNKDSSSYKRFMELLNKYNQDESFLRSLIMKLSTYEGILSHILNDENKVNNFFENNFNEEIHKQPEVEEFIKTAVEFIVESAKEENTGKEKDESNYQVQHNNDTLKNVYSIFRLIKFMNEKGE